MQNSSGPCAACKAQRRKCSAECPFAAQFSPAESWTEKFERVHSVYGASNVAKLLQRVEPHERDDAVASLVFEADHRFNDLVYGVAGPIYFLQQRLRQLDAAFKSASEYLASLPPPPENQKNLDQYLHVLIPDGDDGNSFSADPPLQHQDYHQQSYQNRIPDNYPVSDFSADTQQQDHQCYQNRIPVNDAVSVSVFSADPHQQPLLLQDHYYQNNMIPGNNYPVSVFSADHQNQYLQQDHPCYHQNTIPDSIFSADTDQQQQNHHLVQQDHQYNMIPVPDPQYQIPIPIPDNNPVPDYSADEDDAYSYFFGGVDDDIPTLFQ